MEHKPSIKPSLYSFEHDPYNYVTKVLCSKWKMFILQGIATDGATRFSRFTKQLPISEKVLTMTLKELERDGLILRTVYPEVPVRVEYSLTEVGKGVLPLLDSLYEWGWQRMTELGMEIDPLGEMWRGYRQTDDEIMAHPYKK